ncbi:hypothetical protein FH972_017792 [Carpinus fangiana]|uniref:Uncharacterized protein n=1 Tax=Carpinus fangiana TaxID=176857 RepID=A0A5N6RLB7_9ROSI|nr:hypothetical protein FH972_017792 [Carpinus fangiana]
MRLGHDKAERVSVKLKKLSLGIFSSVNCHHGPLGCVRQWLGSWLRPRPRRQEFSRTRLSCHGKGILRSSLMPWQALSRYLELVHQEAGTS